MPFTSPIRSGYSIDPEGFGWYSYTLNGVNKTAFHSGIDYAASGGTAIYSISDGKVAYASQTQDHPRLC